MIGADPVKLQVISRRLRAMDCNKDNDNDMTNSYEMGFTLYPVKQAVRKQ